MRETGGETETMRGGRERQGETETRRETGGERETRREWGERERQGERQ